MHSNRQSTLLSCHNNDLLINPFPITSIISKSMFNVQFPSVYYIISHIQRTPFSSSSVQSPQKWRYPFCYTSFGIDLKQLLRISSIPIFFLHFIDFSTSICKTFQFHGRKKNQNHWSFLTCSLFFLSSSLIPIHSFIILSFHLTFCFIIKRSLNTAVKKSRYTLTLTSTLQKLFNEHLHKKMLKISSLFCLI